MNFNIIINLLFFCTLRSWLVLDHTNMHFTMCGIGGGLLFTHQCHAELSPADLQLESDSIVHHRLGKGWEVCWQSVMQVNNQTLSMRQIMSRNVQQQTKFSDKKVINLLFTRSWKLDWKVSKKILTLVNSFLLSQLPIVILKPLRK